MLVHRICWNWNPISCNAYWKWKCALLFAQWRWPILLKVFSSALFRCRAIGLPGEFTSNNVNWVINWKYALQYSSSIGFFFFKYEFLMQRFTHVSHANRRLNFCIDWEINSRWNQSCFDSNGFALVLIFILIAWITPNQLYHGMRWYTAENMVPLLFHSLKPTALLASLYKIMILRSTTIQ